MNLFHHHRHLRLLASLLYPLRNFRPFGQKGLTIMYQLADDTGLILTVSAVDDRGNPVTLGPTTLTVTTSDPTILGATLEQDGTIHVEPAGPLGTAQVQVATSTTPPITGAFDVQVVASSAVSFTFTAGSTYPLQPPAPAPQAKP